MNPIRVETKHLEVYNLKKETMQIILNKYNVNVCNGIVKMC